MRFGSWDPSKFPIQFTSPLGWPLWATLAGVPVGIIALYFLKLRRRPVQVSSTLLWRRSLEDLHVNSLFQWLRKNILLYLQLLAVILAMLALAGLRMKGTAPQGQRYVIAIDNSASMSATDVAPTRLDEAKKKAKEVVRKMEAGDLAMVISFADRARVVSSYTGNRSQLLTRIDAIQPTETSTSLRDALQVAAGLANPLRQTDVPEGAVATSIVPPKLLIYTDGGFADVSNFSLGSLEPDVVVIGPPPPPKAEPADPTATPDARAKGAPSDNVAVLALRTSKNEEKPDQFQVFGRVHNYRAEPVKTKVSLLKLDPTKPNSPGEPVDAKMITIAPQSDEAFDFDLTASGSTEMEVQIDVKDALPLDNRAFTLIGVPRKAQVLLVTDGDRYLVNTLTTPTAAQAADVTVVTTDEAKAEKSTREAAAGRYDLVVYDRFSPKVSPAANALYFGAFPPGKPYAEPKTVEAPTILEWKVEHPLLQYVRDLAGVRILKARTVETPPGATKLIETDQGAVGLAVPREGYTDAILTFSILDGQEANTDWPKFISFPLFLFNTVRVLGNARDSIGDEVHQPGQPVVLRSETPQDKIEVVPPGGKVDVLKRTPLGTFIDEHADRTGLYHAKWGKDGGSAFAVNLFDPRESDLAPRGLPPEGVTGEAAEPYLIKIGFNVVSGTKQNTQANKEWWWWLALACLVVVLFEWYVYNRRVYL